MQIRTLIAAFALISAGASGMSQKPKVTVRFHAETNKQDGDTFSAPVHLDYQRRDTQISRTAFLSEKQIKTIFPFRAADGSWGCAFQLNESGKIALETLSSEIRGKSIVAYIGTKNGQHQVVDMIVDRIVSDGIISIPFGITDLEMLVLRNQFKVLGAEPPKPVKKETKEDLTDWRLNHDRQPKPTAPSVSEPRLPRLPD